jgi:hypothetical protein
MGERLLQLRRDLQGAIASEQYEEAARLRDEIQAVESGTDAPASRGTGEASTDLGASRAGPAHP